MNISYRKSQSTVRPQELELSSSESTIYLRKNITQCQRKSGDTGSEQDTVIMYEYDQAELTPREYEEYITKQNKERFDILDQALSEIAAAIAELSIKE